MNTCIVNYHIPRTGGRTRTKVLSSLVGEQDTFYTMGDRKRDLSEYVKMSIEEKRKIKLLTGHMPLSIMKLVPAPKFRITFLRNPLYRSISHYNGLKKFKGHHLEKLINDNNLSLGQFLLAGITSDVYDNIMVRSFIDDSPPFMEIKNTHLEEAKHNLANLIDFVGITEHSDCCLGAIGSLFGEKKHIEVPRVGDMGQQRKLRGLSPYDIRALHTANTYDLEFFDYGLTLFKQHISKYMNQ